MKTAPQFHTSLVLLLTTLGCSGYRVAQRCDERWSQLHTGMFKSEVTEILGAPQSTSQPIHVPPGATNSVMENLAANVIVKTAFDGWFERWEYGHFGFMENLLTPSDKAFIVYFGSDGQVYGLRRPKTGPYAKEN
jgi:hypothetical protein